MSIYLLQNKQQTGPFTEEHVRGLLRTGAVAGGTLGWKEGMANWEPVSTFVSPLTVSSVPGTPPLPPRAKSPLGLISFIISLVTAPIWLVLFAVAGWAHNTGNVSAGFNMGVGLVAVCGLFLNSAAVIVGVVAAFKNRPNTLAIIGACLNAIIILGIIGLICLGLAMQAHAH